MQVQQAEVNLCGLADQLAAEGVDPGEMRELQLEIDALDRPPSLIARMSSAARRAAGKHWRALVGELSESKEAMAIIVARVRGGSITVEDRDKVRAQLVDLVKVFPAGLIAAANSAFPIPGTGIFTPWILSRLGLMPSRWREAHLLDHLSSERDRLRAVGRDQAADAIETIRVRIEHDCEEREMCRSRAMLLTHWDANNNGRWDPEEIDAYRQELERVRSMIRRFSVRKHWFLDNEGEIFGALRLSELCEDDEISEHLHEDGMLVCFDGKTGWLALPDLLGREPMFV